MNAKNLIGGFIAGAALGVAAGLLLAPASGEKTRRKLVKGSMKVKKSVTDYVESSIESLRSQVNQRIDQVSQAAGQVAGKAKETITNGADALTAKVRNNG